MLNSAVCTLSEALDAFIFFLFRQAAFTQVFFDIGCDLAISLSLRCGLGFDTAPEAIRRFPQSSKVLYPAWYVKGDASHFDVIFRCWRRKEAKVITRKAVAG
jgi:hypothetical protein